jgi:predicted AAA+ superfamily ATPase
MEAVIHRAIENQMLALKKSNKVVLLFGTRRVGKTFLMQSLAKKLESNFLFLNGEDLEVREIFQRRTVANLKNLTGNYRTLIIDEAQAIPEIGKALKLMIDTQPELTIFATGSSALDLLNQSGEPLTGRMHSFLLYPIAQLELGQSLIEARQNLDERLIYGSYPEVLQIADATSKAAYLGQLIQSYLLKDILAYSGIRLSDRILSLLRLIAHQVGSEVSYSELGNQLGMNKATVESYLDLLSKVFILYKLPAYSTNARKEISKNAKWYFFDNGIRNAVINDFRPLGLRNDLGVLWETYVLSERIKKMRYSGSMVQFYFWRNYQQQEIDWIEFENGELRAFEIKYSSVKKVKTPSGFRQNYPSIEVQKVDRDNYLEFIV